MFFKCRKRLYGAFLFAAVLFSCLPGGVAARAEKLPASGAANAPGRIVLTGQDISAAGGPVENQAAYQGKTGVARFQGNGAWAEYAFSCPGEANYHIAVEYCPIEGMKGDIEFALQINGAYPYSSPFALSRSYADDGAILQDEQGNDIKPYKKEVFLWNEVLLYDSERISAEPLVFPFKTGENKLKFMLTKGSAAVVRITLLQKSKTGGYGEYRESVENNANHAADASVTIQAENPALVSHTVLSATYDKGSYRTEPSDPVKLKLNTIGQSNWKLPGQWISWRFQIEKEGFYNIGFRFRQNFARGMFSSRKITIDGELPFEEMADVPFEYGINWQAKVLGGDRPFLIYLSKGEHVITMEAVMGGIGRPVKDLQQIILKLNQLYREIIMITGVTPDRYRDYLLDKDIPDYSRKIQNLIDDLAAQKTLLKKLKVRQGSDSVMIDRLMLQLESFLEKPETVPLRINEYNSNISSLSSFMQTMQEQPLELDAIFLSGSAQVALPSGSVWKQIVYRFKTFLGSFYADYSSLGGKKYSGNTLNVWVGAGRDQAQIIKNMTDSYFEPETDIHVNLSLVQQGIIESLAAGKNPDIVIFTSDIVNLASRNALVDLSAFPGFARLEKEFLSSSFTPYRYQGGTYAIPLQQSFYMMFYRTDIFGELGLKPPGTWEEFFDVSLRLNKNKLLVGVPVGTATAPDNSVFDTLLFQNGGTYLNENQSKTEFESNAALKAFRQWTDFYQKFSFPTEFNFYNRFRSGEMPLGIQAYTIYNMLAVAAPEIKGLWQMAPIPGTPDGKGGINRAVSGTGNAVAMFKTVGNSQDGFAFIEWFTGAEMQTEFGQALENILGQGGRYDPANIAALRNMNWTQEELAVLEKQYVSLELPPQIPASYYISRSITNAFRSVVLSGKNARESLFLYNKEINEEIKRKRAEMGIGG